MNERQKRRRSNARLTARATGRTWNVGENAIAAKDNERTREQIAQRVNGERRIRNLTPIPTRMIETPSEHWARAERRAALWLATISQEDTNDRDRGLALETRAARKSAVAVPVRIVDLPVPMIGTFRRLD